MQASEELRSGHESRLWREIKGYLVAFAIAFAITTFLVTSIGVAGASMEPTLQGGSGRLSALVSGDRLLIPKYETWLRRIGGLPHWRRGEVVIAREPADSPLVQGRRVLVVKRIIAVPGDTVEIGNGNVVVNGHELDQDFIEAEGGRLGWQSMAPVTLAEDEYFVLGDNRPNSADSRLYGPIDGSSITGRATAVIFPPRRDGEWNWRVLAPPDAFSQIPEPLGAASGQ